MNTFAYGLSDWQRLDSAAVVNRLIFESTIPPVNNAYRSSLIRSLLTFAFYYVRSRFLRRTGPLDLAPPTLCFGFFKNELAAIDDAIRRHPDWHKRTMSLSRMQGIDWKSVFDPALSLLPAFLRSTRDAGGWPALSNFVYPFTGLLLMKYLERQFAHASARPVVLTTNMMHPLSLGVHLAARRAGLTTFFWEHSMTPRFIARDMGYDHYYLRCEHTRRSFMAAGVPASRLALIGNSGPTPSPAPVPTAFARVGIAVNDLDRMEEIRGVIDMLVAARKQVILRAHDSDRRFGRLQQMASSCNIDFSDASGSSIHQFMTTVDLIIAGNSNVVLDCLMAAMPVIYYWPGDAQLFDYYGIVAAAGCESATALAELEQKLRCAPTISMSEGEGRHAGI